MDNLSINNLLLVTLPEKLIFLALALQVVSCTKILKNNIRLNGVLLLLASIGMTLSDLLVRSVASNILEIALFNLTLYTLITIIVFRELKWYEAVCGALISYIFISSFELFYVPIVMALTNVTPEKIFTNDLYRFIFSFPVRVMQIVLYYIMLKKNISIINFGNMNRTKKMRISLITLALYSTLILIAVYAKVFMFNNFLLSDIKATLTVTIGLGIVLIIVISLITSLYRTDKIRQDKENESNISMQTIFNIYNLLNAGMTEDAKKVIERDIMNSN